MDKSEIKKTARRIANTLNETNYHAVKQIQRLIEHAGLDIVQEHVVETLRIEAEGGMLTTDGKRRRTLGGILFFIIRPKLKPDIRDLVFPPPDWKKHRANKKKAKQEGKDAAQESKQLAAKVAKTTKNIAKLNEKVSDLDSPNTEPSKLQQLHTAAETLRQRLAEMEAKGQKGISMTKTLLKSTEKQIAALEADNAG